MNLWSTDSIIDVFKNLVAGLTGQWIPKGCRWRTPTGSSISGARQRVGSRVMTRLFEKLARPLATLQTPGAFLNGLRWMAIDGTLFDIPDTDSNARVVKKPRSKFKSKKRSHRTGTTQLQPLTFAPIPSAA